MFEFMLVVGILEDEKGNPCGVFRVQCRSHNRARNILVVGLFSKLLNDV